MLYYSFVERALGFRAKAQKLHRAVVEGTKAAPIPVAHDSAAAPVNLAEGVHCRGIAVESDT